MATVEARAVIYPGWESKFLSLPEVQATLGVVARLVETRTKLAVSGSRVTPFRKKMFARPHPTLTGAWVAGTDWKLANLWEFGSANTTTHAWLRRSCSGIPSTRYEPA